MTLTRKAFFPGLLIFILLVSCILSQALPPSLTAAPTLEPTPASTPIPLDGLYSVSMRDRLNGWGWSQHADGSNSLLHSLDGGHSWKDVTPADLPGISEGFFLDAQTAWVQTFDSASSISGLGLTTDAGLTWTQVAASVPFNNALLHFTDPQEGWAAGYDVGAGQAYISLYATHDGGRTWTQLMLTDPDSQDNSTGQLHLCGICGDTFYYDPARLIIVYGDMANPPSGSLRLAVTTNLGTTWKKLSVPFPSPALAAAGLVDPGMPVFFDAGAAVLPVDIVTYNADGSLKRVLAVYSSADGGLSWTTGADVLEGAGSAGSVDFVNATDGFSPCGGGLCATHDAGRSWTSNPTSLSFSETQSGEYVWRFSFFDAFTGWAITTDPNNHYGLYATSDTGLTWTKIAPVLLP
jgi:photosystem II stability/assembly factor-like uncharacterized protein